MRNHNDDRFLTFFFVVLFLFTTQPGNVFEIESLTTGNFFVLIPILLALVVSLRYNIKLYSKTSVIIYSILFIWSIMLYYYRGIPISPYPFIEVFLADIALRTFHDNLFERFINVSVKLSIVAIVGWILCNIDHSLMLKFTDEVSGEGFGISKTLYIFSIPINTTGIAGIYRNCGYAWEPGRFACFVILALFFHLMKNGISWKDKKVHILIFALITSQSTTGYFIFFLLLTLLYIANGKIRPIHLIVSISLFSISLSLPFMREKVMDLMVTKEDMQMKMKDMDYATEHNTVDKYYVPQRFQSFAWQMMNLEKAPILTGEGRNFQNFYLNRVLGYRLVLSEGILGVIVRYGWILAFIFYFTLLKSSYTIAKKFKHKHYMLFAVLFIIMNFSYYLWEAPLIISFIVFAYYSVGYNHKKNQSLHCVS